MTTLQKIEKLRRLHRAHLRQSKRAQDATGKAHGFFAARKKIIATIPAQEREVYAEKLARYA